MKPTYILLILFILATQLSHASGQRTEKITIVAIDTYPEVFLQNNPLPEKALHYIGTYNNQWHIFMQTLTSVSEINTASGTKHLGMPSDTILKYKISTTNITIINGWNINHKIIATGIEVRPSKCPAIVLSPTKKEYEIKDSKAKNADCLRMQGNHQKSENL